VIGGAGLTVFLCGDVMTGRGIDQVLPHPGDPRIHEPCAPSAELYVRLAESANGPIPGPVDFSYIWGDALDELAKVGPSARVVNLETSVTRSDDYWRGKGINYRMNPANVPCITAARIDCCVLANNHTLDYGHAGLLETIGTLQQAGVKVAGAGRNRSEARAPAVIDVSRRSRVLVFGFGSVTSGIPSSWAATDSQPGISLLEDLSDTTLDDVRETIRRVKRPRDIVVASIHWGGNWGYGVPEEHVRFAHGLIRAGADVVHGHSSHHVRPIEVFEGKLILYGCGDFLADYEGIPNEGVFRSDLALMYFPTVDPILGRLSDLLMTPMRVKNFKANRASVEEARWLRDTINRESRDFDVRVGLRHGCRLELLGLPRPDSPTRRRERTGRPRWGDQSPTR
jgi:poly-gamma-glutamate synthesis protein (capsule biosynthesis protein)